MPIIIYLFSMKYKNKDAVRVLIHTVERKKDDVCNNRTMCQTLHSISIYFFIGRIIDIHQKLSKFVVDMTGSLARFIFETYSR
jgi:hypothetical protein